MKLPRTAPLTYGSLTKEQFDKEIEKEKINDGEDNQLEELLKEYK